MATATRSRSRHAAPCPTVAGPPWALHRPGVTRATAARPTGMELGSVAVVAAVALAAPLALGLTGLRLPAIVLEILLGVAVGPQGLGWAQADEPVQVLALFGLAFLLLLAGLEIDFDRLRGRLLRLTLAAYVLSFAIALAVGLGLKAGDLIRSP